MYKKEIIAAVIACLAILGTGCEQGRTIVVESSELADDIGMRQAALYRGIESVLDQVDFTRYNGRRVKLVVDEPAKAKEALDKSGMTCYLQEVLALNLDSRSGTLASISAQMAERGVNVSSIYFTTPAGASKSQAILCVSDIETALAALKK